jgi:hydrogenase maturation protease
VTVVGLGTPAAGDDGVGVAVIALLRADPPPGVELVAVRNAAPLVDLLDGRDVVLVDAVAGLGAPGTLRWLEPADLARVGAWSTHGVSVPHAIGLAEVLNGPDAARRLRILGVAIAHACPSMTLSDEVAAAVPLAAAEIRSLLEARDA